MGRVLSFLQRRKLGDVGIAAGEISCCRIDKFVLCVLVYDIACG
jgi:hypothetical protein